MEEILKMVRNESEGTIPIPKMTSFSLTSNINQIICMLSSGVMLKTAFSPLERIKILQQTRDVWTNYPHCNLKRYSMMGLIKGKGQKMTKEIRANQGWQGYFRGNSANVVKILPVSVARLMVYNNMKRVFLHRGEFFHQGTDLYVRKTLCILLSSLISNTAIYPLERIRVLMTLNMDPDTVKTKRSTILKTFWGVMKKDRGMYRGYWLHCFASIPYSLTLFVFYDFYRNIVQSETSGIHYVSNQLYVMGIASSLTAMVLTHPLDTIRKNLQADSCVVLSKRRYFGARDCLKKIVKAQGVLSLWRGLTPALVKLPPYMLLNIALYDSLKQALDDATSL